MTPPTPTPTAFLQSLQNATPENTPPTQRAKIRRQARNLHLTCALPTWFHDAPAHPSTQAHLTREAYSTLQAKATLTGYPVNTLGLVYLRALRDTPPTAPTPPGMTRDDVAQARVNALIQLAELDPSASTRDEDLLPLMKQEQQQQQIPIHAVQR